MRLDELLLGESASNTPLGDRQACLSGAECGYLRRRRTIPLMHTATYFLFVVAAPERDPTHLRPHHFSTRHALCQGQLGQIFEFFIKTSKKTQEIAKIHLHFD